MPSPEFLGDGYLKKHRSLSYYEIERRDMGALSCFHTNTTEYQSAPGSEQFLNGEDAEAAKF
jgi:hypothetical protein